VLSNFNGANVGITDGNDYEGRLEIGSHGLIYITNFMEIGSGI
jgi:hypothetical protein